MADHPRVSGEHDLDELADCVKLGSSPRERGARSGAMRPESDRGIIPA